MIKSFKHKIFLLYSLVICVGCVSDETTIAPEQRELFTKYLESKSLEYEEIDGVMRYIANADREDRDTQATAITGDTVVCRFEAYTFNNGPMTLFYSNKEIVMEDKEVEPPIWSRDPLEIVVGGDQYIKGLELGIPNCVAGDSLQLFITSNLAYGDKWMYSVPKDSPLLYIINVTEIKKR